jgi:hypothetical protein
MFPANPQMWNNFVGQAKARFPHSNPRGGMTRPEVKWVKEKYAQAGGQFVDSKDDVDPRFRDYKKEEADKERRKENEKKKRRNRGELVL